jgi:hypothetical protein
MRLGMSHIPFPTRGSHIDHFSQSLFSEPFSFKTRFNIMLSCKQVYQLFMQFKVAV